MSISKKSKVSYPKLHSLTLKGGLHAPNIDFHPMASFDRVGVDDVLYGAHKEGLEDVLIIGVDSWGNEYIAMSDPDMYRAHYLAQRAALAFLRDADTF